MEATNRQKKLLNFFGISYSPRISVGAAGWDIADLLADPDNKDLWHRYLYLTRDFDVDSALLKEFSYEDLENVEIPDGWDASAQVHLFLEGIVDSEMADGSPYDQPQPEVVFAGKAFMFTGKFLFGSRKTCQGAVIERGGSAPSRKSVNREIDYLVVGSEGSERWKRGSYGTKIEAAILSRREHGTPAIISEDHWKSELNAVG